MSRFPVRAAVVLCEDCGRTRIWSAEDARRIIDPITQQPKRRIFCSKCRNLGGEGYNVKVELKAGEALALATHHDPMNRFNP